MPEEKIFVADSFVMAQARLVQIARAGDVVLYENDLPDTFK
jgi:UDP-N-acetylmuramoyl-tripeptide--D-alanyl-D-alanine ligase